MIDPVATYALRQPERLACIDIDGGGTWTWRALDADISRAAHWLIAQLGPRSGARVATLARNSTVMLILQFACARAGAVFVPLNWRLADAEIKALIADASPSLLFKDAEFAVAAAAVQIHALSDLSTLTADQASGAPARSARQEWHAPSTLLYTSGTSGKPKGVMLSEANAFFGANNFINGYDVTSDSIFLCDMPLFHTAGLFGAARSAILAGAMLYISRGFDPVKTLARIADPALGITVYFSVPQMAQMLWNQPGFVPEMLQSLRVYATGGAPNPKAQIERFIAAGIRMSDGFGMTETGSNFGMPLSGRSRIVEKAGSIGQPFLSVETQIVDADGHEVATGERGELWLRGQSVSPGYWQQPGLTADAFHDGWFKSGDICVRDSDGYFFIVDRKKDVFISGGENVYPAEVEAVIAELLAVAECAVVGVADAHWGEVGHACVVPVAGADVSEGAILAHCTARLARFKVPKQVIIMTTLPRTASGKVQKHVIKDGFQN